MKKTTGSVDSNLILSRLQDYRLEDPAIIRTRLVKKWKEAYPEAANEISDVFHFLIKNDTYKKPKDAPELPDEEWFNDKYSVTLRRKEKDPVFGTNGGMIQLGISSLDGTARHDFRDFQEIKNQLAGEECEAFELYPAQSRLLDPSNYYSLWCFPGIKRIKVGNEFNRVWDADVALAPQRAFPSSE